ncbi:hypothetical protein TREES_T100014084 [Tupaia chinensis]|uniref:Uncharacterized protein n=1 Tax=Tupaia chinensis TaxID=246437 RepID=L9KK11_TUPCH|nr:hypothetical protein TREES_T100014084 [Tupaia chinensis]
MEASSLSLSLSLALRKLQWAGHRKHAVPLRREAGPTAGVCLRTSGETPEEAPARARCRVRAVEPCAPRSHARPRGPRGSALAAEFLSRVVPASLSPTLLQAKQRSTRLSLESPVFP